MQVGGDVAARLLDAERERFHAARPRSLSLGREARASMPNGVPMSWQHLMYDHAPIWVAHGRGAWFEDVDGHAYADFNIADTSAFCGHAPEPTTRAVAERLAAGGQFLLPTEDALVVAVELGRRYGLPAWQFTLAATSANVEAIRIARLATGRPLVLLFDGHYHGGADEFFAASRAEDIVSTQPAAILRSSLGDVRIVPFNDPDALAAALADERVACVLGEPAMTNNQGVIQPLPAFHEALRRATRETGTLLVLDETHTQICGPGGLTRELGLEPDVVTLGKSIGGGFPIGAYGMTPRLAEAMERSGGWSTGGNPVRQRGADGGLPRDPDRGSRRRRLRAGGGARRAPRGRHRTDRRRRGAAVARASPVRPLRILLRRDAAHERRRGARRPGRRAVGADAGVAREPRRLGGDRRRRPGGQRRDDRGRGRPLPRVPRRPRAGPGGVGRARGWKA
jgi:acetylornithine/succinyldiaminopimelate/putrescine aminotransferase